MTLPIVDPEVIELDDLPIVTTDSHVYLVLGVDQWPAAYRFIADTLGPDTPVENDPENTSILAAVNRETLDIDGVMFANRVVLAQRYTALPGSVVSEARMHEVLRAYLPPETVYYAEAVDGTIAEVVGGGDGGGVESVEGGSVDSSVRGSEDR